MCIVRERKEAQSLKARAKDIETKIKTDMIEEKIQEEDNTFKNREIYENVAVEDLMNEKYKSSLIIYNEKIAVNHNDKIIYYHNQIQISDLLEDLIKIHNYIQSPKHIKHATATSITQIRFNKNDQNMILSVDVNYAANSTINYKDINEIIDINNNVNPKSRIERNNQSLGAISSQLRKTV